MPEHTVSTSDAPLSSCEISSRVKGPPSVTVKVYHADPDKAASEAIRIYGETVDALDYLDASVEA